MDIEADSFAKRSKTGKAYTVVFIFLKEEEESNRFLFLFFLPENYYNMNPDDEEAQAPLLEYDPIWGATQRNRYNKKKERQSISDTFSQIVKDCHQAEMAVVIIKVPCPTSVFLGGGRGINFSSLNKALFFKRKIIIIIIRPTCNCVFYE